MLVTRADQRFADCRSPITDWQCFPILGFCLRNQLVELVLSFENSAERQSRFGGDRGRTNQEKCDEKFPAPHVKSVTERGMEKVTRSKPLAGYNLKNRSIAAPQLCQRF